MADAILKRQLILREIVDRLVTALDPDRINLFGARSGQVARGNDDDVMVLVDHQQEP